MSEGAEPRSPSVGAEPRAGTEPRSPAVREHAALLTRAERFRALGQAGATLWLTGLPSSGKSTVAAALERRLVLDGRVACRLDGDNLRTGLSGDLGFAPEARAEHIRRVAQVAALLADAGVVVLAALVSPLASDRARARQIHAAAGLPFAEIWVDTPVEVCEQRDPKGLYARARRGELPDFTGVSAPYEPPERPELRIRGAELELADAVESALGVLAATAPLPGAAG